VVLEVYLEIISAFGTKSSYSLSQHYPKNSALKGRGQCYCGSQGDGADGIELSTQTTELRGKMAENRFFCVTRPTGIVRDQPSLTAKSHVASGHDA